MKSIGKWYWWKLCNLNLSIQKEKGFFYFNLILLYEIILKEFPYWLTQGIIYLSTRQKRKLKDLQFVTGKIDCKFSYDFESIDSLKGKLAETVSMPTIIEEMMSEDSTQATKTDKHLCAHKNRGKVNLWEHIRFYNEDIGGKKRIHF